MVYPIDSRLIVDASSKLIEGKDLNINDRINLKTGNTKIEMFNLAGYGNIFVS